MVIILKYSIVTFVREQYDQKADYNEGSSSNQQFVKLTISEVTFQHFYNGYLMTWLNLIYSVTIICSVKYIKNTVVFIIKKE